jgi:tetratricopeptide (TPR) repeat protein
MKRAKLLRILLLRIGAAAMFLWIAGLPAVPQQPPGKTDRPLAGPVDSEKAPPSAALAAQESELRRDLASHPNSAPALYRLGLVLRQENKPKDSLEIYTRAALFAKPDAEQLRSVALDYVLLDDFNDAIHWLRIAEGLEPKNVDVLYSLGRCFYSQDRFPEAEALLLRVLALRPDHLKAEENLGLIYGYTSRPEKAETALRKAVALAGDESTDEWPFLDLAGFLLDQNRPSEAVPLLQRATTIAPKSAVCYEKLGRSLLASGDAIAGVKELETAIELDPKNPKIHFELGMAYRSMGAVDKAHAEFALSQKLYGEHSSD